MATALFRLRNSVLKVRHRRNRQARVREANELSAARLRLGFTAEPGFFIGHRNSCIIPETMDFVDFTTVTLRGTSFGRFLFCDLPELKSLVNSWMG